MQVEFNDGVVPEGLLSEYTQDIAADVIPLEACSGLHNDPHPHPFPHSL